MPRVLIADEDGAFREDLAAALRRGGLDAAVAPGPAQAARAARAYRPDLLVLCIGPCERGYLGELSRLRADPDLGRLPVILITARAERGLIPEIVRMGVKDLILKTPAVIPALVQRVRARLGAVDPEHPAPSRPGPAPGVEEPPLAAAEPRAARPPALRSGRRTPETLTLAEASRELEGLSPLAARAELLERLEKSAELRALSPVVHQVSKLAGSPSTSLEAVASAIKQDPAICVKILKVANSALYAGGSPVETVGKAVSRIGLGQIQQAVAGLAVVERFGHTALGQRAGSQEFWEHSIAVGLLAAAIGRAWGLKGEAADGLFTAGLLHDVGRVIAADEIGDSYARVMEEAERLGLPLEQVEARLLGTTHAEIAERILRAWKFPGHLVTPIALHHTGPAGVRSAAPASVREAATLALADRLAHALLLGASGNETVYPTRELAQLLELTPEMLDALARDIPEKTGELKLAMLARGHGEAGPAQIQSWRRGLRPDLKLVYLATQPGLDALGFWCQRLAPCPPEAAPDAVIMMLGSPREQRPLGQALAELEGRHGTTGLGVVALSPSGSLAPEPLAGPCQRLALPCPLGRLTGALRAVLE